MAPLGGFDVGGHLYIVKIGVNLDTVKILTLRRAMVDDAGYHHGDLRRALLDAARETLRRDGPARLSLRAVARAADVSHAAPYHHFRDKDALLAALAEEGFQELREVVEIRAAAARSPDVAMQEAAVAYILFAVDQPELFRVMFGPQLADETSHPTLRSSARAAYRTIEEGLERCVPPSSAANRLESMAMGSWALIHGLAVLILDGQILAATPAEVERLAREITRVFWGGLSTAVVISSEGG